MEDEEHVATGKSSSLMEDVTTSSDDLCRRSDEQHGCVLGTEYAMLAREVEDLTRDPPPYARLVGGLQQPKVVASDDGSLIWPGTGELQHCDLHVIVQGSPQCEAYNAPFRLRFRFLRSWPQVPPVVRFCSIIHHSLVDADDREMLYSFYASLPREADGSCTLRGLLAAVHAMLSDPRSTTQDNSSQEEGRLSNPPLALANRASRYEGSVTHTALGQGSYDLVVTIHSQVSETCFDGKWEAMGKSGPAVVHLDFVARQLRVHGETMVGVIDLEGHDPAGSGAFCGSCLLSGSPGGTFELKPTEAGDEARAEELRNFKRLDVIRKYGALVKYPELFAQDPAWREAWLDSAFLRAHKANTAEAWREMLSEHLPGQVFSFPLFSNAFCDLLVEEILNFYSSGLPARRPNSMNNYGIILNEIGLERWVDSLQELLQPLGELLWPGPGTAWDGHHCFVVRYREGEDLGLDMHTDDSDVTFNVCLGLEFGGAGLQFCGMSGTPGHRKQTYTYNHVRGHCLVHLGRHRHGADDITWGERLNLILWNHSGAYRRTKDFESPPYEREGGPPDLACLSYTHDRDFGAFKSYERGRERFAANAWCPPRHAEYPGFRSVQVQSD